MRNGFIGLASALVLASTTMAGAGCSSSSGGTNGSGGSGSGGAGSGGHSSGSGGTGSGGTSGADAGGTSVTSISGSKALGTLTTTEADQLCNDTRSYYARSISKADNCKFTALSFALSSSAPTEADLRIGCSASESACNQPDAGTGGPTCYPIPSTCTATVAQYSACIKDETVDFNHNVSTLPGCTTLTRADFDMIYMVIPGANPPAGCAALATACPDLTPPYPP